MRADLYSAAGAKLNYPPLVAGDILALQYRPALNEIGTFALDVGGNAASVANLAIAQQLWLYAEEGLMFKGVIEEMRREIATDGASIVHILGRSTGAKLGWKTTSLGLSFSNQTLSTVVSTLLTSSGFSSGSVASPSTNITTRFDGRSIWDALRFVAETFGLSVREDNLATEVDVNSFGSASGIILSNRIAQLGVAAGNHIPISSIKKRTYALDVWNKVIPLAQQTGIGGSKVWFTLENSDRSSPYTIQTETGPDGNTVYYLSDSTSVSTYGTREKVIQVTDILPLGVSATDMTRAANTLYDSAATYLTRHKDEQAEYTVEVVGLTHIDGGAYRFQVGDTMKVQYNGVTEDADGRRSVLTVDADLYLMGFQRTFDSSGADKWTLTLSTVLRQIPDDGNRTADFLRQLESVKGTPLPFVLFGDNVARVSPSGFELIAVDGGSALGLPPDATRVKWLRDAFTGDAIADVVAGYFTPSTFDYNQLFLRAFPGVDGANVMAGIWDLDAEDWLAAMFMNYVSDVPSWVIGTTIEAWLQLSQTDASNYSLKILKNGVLTEVGGSMKSANTGAYLIPTLGAGGAVRSGNGSYGSWAAIGLADIAAPAAPTATTFASSVNHNVTMPATVNAGDLLVVILATVGATDPATPTGWASVGTQANGSNSHISVFSKSADGTEDGTTVNFTVAGGSVGAAHVYRIPTGTWDTGAAIAISTGATAAGNPDPSSVTPTQVGRFLAIACAAEQSGIGSFNTAHGGYSGFTESHNGTGASDVAVVSSYLTGLNTNTENPGAYSGGSITNSAAFVIAIQASPAISEAAYVTGLDVVVSGTPGYLQVQLATGAIGAESVIGTFKVNTADPTLEFPAIIPVATGTRISVRLATDTGAANHNVTLHVINQDDVA